MEGTHSEKRKDVFISKGRVGTMTLTVFSDKCDCLISKKLYCLHC